MSFSPHELTSQRFKNRRGTLADMPEDVPDRVAGAQFTRDQIRAVWTEKALQFGQSPSASWTDHPMIELEIRTISKFLNPGDHVLEIGCANGFSTLAYAEAVPVRIVGLDEIPEMVAEAQKRLETAASDTKARISFGAGDATSLTQVESASFDKVISTRTIINLPTAEDQRHALAECARALRPGGLLLLSEATLQGWSRLNALRAEWGLSEIPMPPFNNYLDEDEVKAVLSEELEFVSLTDFSSSYYIGTRFLKPILAALHGGIDPADPNTEFNRLCASIPSMGDHGTQRLFVFRRR